MESSKFANICCDVQRSTYLVACTPCTHSFDNNPSTYCRIHKLNWLTFALIQALLLFENLIAIGSRRLAVGTMSKGKDCGAGPNQGDAALAKTTQR